MPIEAFANSFKGARSSRTLARIVSGAVMPDADMVARIEVLTGNSVTASDMHATRLAWLRANRPEKFANAIPEAAE